ncbi:MAG: UvrD-helicase domain-containing protein [Pirellulales bacterium]
MPHGLNPAQHAAVTTLSGPLLVLAGAGTGKTRVVTHRVAELIRRGTRPGRILAVTFTNKAAGEMQRRAAALIGKSLGEKPEVSTFHSLCVRILRRHAPRLGYPARFAIYDRGDSESVARGVLREIKVPDGVLRPGELLYLIGRWKMHSFRPEKAAALAQTDKEHLASMAYRRYQQALAQAGALDFDDLLLCTEELFARFADARAAEAARFTHLLIDEYQDTNASQYRIVRALAERHRNLCVVGDDDQSIYGWRGADVSHILRFKHDWPDAKVVRLEENYRSTEPILTLANRLIRYNRLRHDKVLRPARTGGEKPKILQCQDAEAEARFVVEDIRARLASGAQERDFAVLFRTNEQPRPFEAELRKAKLPYVLVGGQSFYDRKEVRDVLSYLKLLVTPSDEIALRRVINTPARGIGRRAQEALVGKAVAAGKPLWEILPAAAGLEGVSPAAAEAALRLRQLIEQFRARLARDSLVEVASSLIRQIGYQDELSRLYADPAERQARWVAVEEVVNTLADYQKRARRPTLAGFLDEVAVGDREIELEKDRELARNAIALMTLHSAKGLEFPHVYLVGMEEGLLPHRKSIETDDAQIDEERRLCYVGITRARDHLTISLALSRMKWGKPRPTKPSRFLFELTGQADTLRPKGARPPLPRKRSRRLAVGKGPGAALAPPAGKPAQPAKIAPRSRPAK